jgi:hypothetical protein
MKIDENEEFFLGELNSLACVWWYWLLLITVIPDYYQVMV